MKVTFDGDVFLKSWPITFSSDIFLLFLSLWLECSIFVLNYKADVQRDIVYIFLTNVKEKFS